MEQLQKIVLTPVKNEAWVLPAFLSATSIWADTIIVADQQSTDGSRDIYKRFPKVIVVDNPLLEMNQSETRRLLLETARRLLKGSLNAILFALDADEFLSGDFLNTKAWKCIMNSKPNDAFCWRWMNLKKGDLSQYSTFCHYYWAVHVSEDIWNGIFPDRVIHEWRLPWVDNKMNEMIIDDFCSLHFARVNELRQKNKERFYQVVSLSNRSVYNSVNLYRQYHSEDKLEYFSIPSNAFYTYDRVGINICGLLDYEDDGQYYSTMVIDFFYRYGLKKYAFLDIWDRDWCIKNNVKSPQRLNHRIILKYLSITNQHRFWLVRAIDKLLGVFV